MNRQTPYQLLGEEKIIELANAFYDVMDELPEAQGIRKMHGEDLSEIKQKLADYLIGWMGGPPKYHDKYGTVCLTDPHKPYHIGPAERDQWLLCMDIALERVDAPEEVVNMLKVPMQRIAEAVKNRDSSKPSDPNIIASS